MKIGIVGAGIIGLALAHELRRRGAEVLLVDRQSPATEATFAAAGLLAPSSEAARPGEFFDLCRAAAVLYPDYVRDLEQDTGLSAEYSAQGTLYLFHSAAEREELERRFQWQRDLGIPIVHMDEGEARVLEPRVRAAGGYFLPGDCHVNNRVMAAVLAHACRGDGVQFHTGEVAEIVAAGGRATGLLMADGSVLSADAFVNAAGAWASRILAPAIPRPDVRPVRGHMLAIATGKWEAQYVLHDASVYIVPRSGPRVVIGSTMEEAGFDKTVHPTTIGQLRASAERLVPKLTEFETVETWTGLRPATPDGRPLIGPTSLRGYFLAVGHLRNGILLAPITAKLLAPVILGAAPEPLLAPFLPKVG